MFISEDEYLLAGTDLGYISAKRNERGQWVLNIPEDARFDAEFRKRYAKILGELNSNRVEKVVREVRGNIENLASGTHMADLKTRTIAKLVELSAKGRPNVNRRPRV